MQQTNFITPSRPLSRLVVPKLVRQSPVHDWFVFPHSFAPGLVADIVQAFDVPLDQTIVDCFVGSGTTAVAAQALGFRTLAADLMPLACLATRVKTATYDVPALRKAMRSFRVKAPARVMIDRFNTVQAAFSEKQLDELDAIAAWSAKFDPKMQDFFRLALARAIEPHSKLKKAGGWLKVVEDQVDEGPVRDTFLTITGEMIDSVERRGEPRHDCQVDLADARELPWDDASASLALTSPPYLNKHDYTRVFCLELAVACGMTWDEIRALRNSTLRSHIEAHDPDNETAQMVPYVEEWIAAVGPGLDRRLPRLVRGYFRDMKDVLRELARVVRPGGHVVFVVGDVRFAGMVLPVASFLTQIAAELELTPVGSQVARYRGNSAQQMKAHGRVGVPEWILAWQR